METAVKI
jgi:hypothetical protein